MFYHVRIKASSHKYFINKTDLTEEELKTKLITPYENGNTLVINGKIINIEDLESISIYESNESIKTYIEQIEQEQSESPLDPLLKLQLPPAEHTAMNRTSDVTDKYISGAPGSKKESSASKNSVETDNKKIFIVHGHDEATKEKVARFIEKISLKAIILHEQVNKGNTIIEKFENHAQQVGFAVVLLTPDDMGYQKDKENLKQQRARQNVILELGYFTGLLGRDKVCVLTKGNIEVPSDYLGVVYTPLDDAGAWQLTLAKEIKESGINIDFNAVL